MRVVLDPGTTIREKTAVWRAGTLDLLESSRPRSPGSQHRRVIEDHGLRTIGSCPWPNPREEGCGGNLRLDERLGEGTSAATAGTGREAGCSRRGVWGVVQTQA